MTYLKANTKKRLKTAGKVTETSARTVGGIIGLVLKIIGTVVLIAICTALLFTCVFAIYVKKEIMPNLSFSVSDFTLDLSSTIYCEDPNTGQYVELAVVHGEVNRDWVDYKDMPIALSHAAVAIEDKRFYTHKGVDWYRTIAAFGNMFLGMKDTFGGSTITQQMIKNVTHYDDVTIKRKFTEIFRALDYEKTNSKEDILELYLNTIYLGEGCYGVGSASYKYFGKDVSELTLAECASLIGITNNPSLYDPYINRERNLKRQQLILDEMYDQGFIETEAEYRAAKNQNIEFREEELEQENSQVYSWFVDTVIRDVMNDLQEKLGYSEQLAQLTLYRGGLQIYTTLNPEIQAKMDEVFTDLESLPQSYRDSSQQLQAAMVIEDPYTGDIVALAGGTGDKADYGSLSGNHATLSMRPPGSSIKPLSVYSPALDLGMIQPYTVFDDNKEGKLKGTNWYPNNDDYKNNGVMTVRNAVRRSVNTVAAQIVDKLTPAVSFDYLKNRYGLTTLVESKTLADGRTISDIGYASMALGQLSYGATVRDMTAAYTAFSNKGIMTKGRTYTRILDSNGELLYENIPESRVAVSEVAAWQMQSMMRDVVRGGTGYEASIENMYTCGKTGSSSSWQDRWFCGFTPYYTSAIWVGYETPEHLYFNGNPACQIWKRVMAPIHEGLENREFERPEGMKQVTVCIDTGKLATEICKNDIRGDRSVTEWVPVTSAPNSICDCHVWTEVCIHSGCKPTADCPKNEVVKVGVLDPEGLNYEVLTPELFDKDDEEKQIYYVLSEIPLCPDHLTDPETGWRIDPDTGYLITPYNEYRLYDKETGKYYDKWSGWELDLPTGMLIHPETGKLIDPYTGLEYVPPQPPPEDDGGEGEEGEDGGEGDDTGTPPAVTGASDTSPAQGPPTGTASQNGDGIAGTLFYRAAA